MFRMYIIRYQLNLHENIKKLPKKANVIYSIDFPQLNNGPMAFVKTNAMIFKP